MEWEAGSCQQLLPTWRSRWGSGVTTGQWRFLSPSSRFARYLSHLPARVELICAVCVLEVGSQTLLPHQVPGSNINTQRTCARPEAGGSLAVIRPLLSISSHPPIMTVILSTLVINFLSPLILCSRFCELTGEWCIFIWTQMDSKQVKNYLSRVFFLKRQIRFTYFFFLFG